MVTGEGGYLRRSPSFLEITEDAKAQLSGSCQARGIPLRALHVEKEEAGSAGLLFHWLPGRSSIGHIPSLSLHLLTREILISGSELRRLKAIHSLIRLTGMQ